MRSTEKLKKFSARVFEKEILEKIDGYPDSYSLSDKVVCASILGLSGQASNLLSRWADSTLNVDRQVTWISDVQRRVENCTDHCLVLYWAHSAFFSWFARKQICAADAEQLCLVIGNAIKSRSIVVPEDYASIVHWLNERRVDESALDGLDARSTYFIAHILLINSEYLSNEYDLSDALTRRAISTLLTRQATNDVSVTADATAEALLVLTHASDAALDELGHNGAYHTRQLLKKLLDAAPTFVKRLPDRTSRLECHLLLTLLALYSRTYTSQ